MQLSHFYLNLVATPGRLKNLVESNDINICDVEFVILGKGNEKQIAK